MPGRSFARRAATLARVSGLDFARMTTLGSRLPTRLVACSATGIGLGSINTTERSPFGAGVPRSSRPWPCDEAGRFYLGAASDLGASAPRGDLANVLHPQTSLPVVALPVAGRCVVSIADLRAKLGRGGFRVWESLITRRNRDGFTHVTRKGLATAESFVAVSDKTVQRALARLRSAGLVSDCGWQELLVPVGRKGAKAVRKVFVRRVYGARVGRSQDGETQALVPVETARWIEAASSHGGRRRNAGRPRTRPLTGSRPRFGYLTDCRKLVKYLRRKLGEAHARWTKGESVSASPALGIDWPAICAKLGRCPGPRRQWHIDHIRPLASFDWHDPETPARAFAPENHQWLTASENLRKSDKIDDLDLRIEDVEFFRAMLTEQYRTNGAGKNPRLRVINGGGGGQEGAGSGASRGGDFSQTRDGQVGAPRDLERTPIGVSSFSSQAQRKNPPHGGALFSKVIGMKYNGEETEVGLLLGTPGRQPLPIFGDHIPTYPCSMQVPMVRVPGPPLLDARLGPQRRRSTLARWFKAALVSRFGAKAKGAGSGFARSPKIVKLLDEAADAFIEHEIAPAAWAAWCCDVSMRLFQADTTKPKPPTIFWVYSKRWIAERVEWFEHEADTIGGRMIATPAHDQLTRVWYAMDRELRLERAITREAQDKIIAKHFPEDTYRDLVEQAHSQTAKMQDAINSLARSGDKWLW